MKSEGAAFKELKEALRKIENAGITEQGSEEDDRWDQILRAVVADEAMFGTLSDDELEAVASGTTEITFETERIERLREKLRGHRKGLLLDHWRILASRGKLTPAAAFRRDGSPNAEEQEEVLKVLKRIQRDLDDEGESDLP